MITTRTLLDRLGKHSIEHLGSFSYSFIELIPAFVFRCYKVEQQQRHTIWNNNRYSISICSSLVVIGMESFPAAMEIRGGRLERTRLAWQVAGTWVLSAGAGFTIKPQPRWLRNWKIFEWQYDGTEQRWRRSVVVVGTYLLVGCCSRCCCCCCIASELTWEIAIINQINCKIPHGKQFDVSCVFSLVLYIIYIVTVNHAMVPYLT